MEARDSDRVRDVFDAGGCEILGIGTKLEGFDGEDGEERSTAEKDVKIGVGLTYIGFVTVSPLISCPFWFWGRSFAKELAIESSSKINGVVPNTFSSFLVDLISLVLCAESSRLQVGGGAWSEDAIDDGDMAAREERDRDARGENDEDVLGRAGIKSI
jgi:hypothetical protein